VEKMFSEFIVDALVVRISQRDR